jgi:dTDP-4-amino-4,6-dideoxygalactose transaminase
MSACPAIAKELGPANDDSPADDAPIPLVDLKANYRAIQGEIDHAISKVVGSCWFIGGPAVQGFQTEFAAYCGASHCVGVNSGTDALFLALKHLGIGPGDEVILPANTFIATALAVSSAGADVVLCDCEPDSFLMDATLLESVVTSKTKVRMNVCDWLGMFT